jgi:tricarballylate dehydrogenase
MAQPAEFDLVVVGSGAAGLSAAVNHGLVAAAAGRRPEIAVLESAPREERGGATAWTTAGFRASRAGGLDPMWIGVIMESSKGLADLDYCRAYERNALDSLQFLEDHGVGLIERSTKLSMQQVFPETVLPNGGGRAVVDVLAAALENKLGGTIFYRSEAIRLLLDVDGRVAGVLARTAEGLSQEFRAPAVVLACGGFEGSKEMLTRYLGPKACDLKLIAPGVSYNRGAGLRMAMEIGADTSGQFDMMHAELVDSRSTRADAVIYPHEYGILVNEAGKRFYDEGAAPSIDSQELLAYEIWRNQNQTAFFIADAQVRANPMIVARFDTDQPPVAADTIEGLAEQLGIDPDALVETVTSFNAAVDKEIPFDPDTLDGKGTNGLEPPKSNWALPIIQAPFFAFPVTAAIVFTFGGLRTNAEGQVISGGGAPIPGLYAAGEIVGVYYHHYQAGTSVLKAITTGRIVGRHTAEIATKLETATAAA